LPEQLHDSEDGAAAARRADALEPRKRGAVLGELRRRDFDRDVPIGLRVEGAVDSRMPPAARSATRIIEDAAPAGICRYAWRVP